jgi:outer membrane beta-barrel protein
MIRALLNLSILVAGVFVFNAPARAEKIEFPEEELATESVLPTFDQPSAVKKRNVSTEHRLEIGGHLGAGLNEAFFDQTLFGINLGYHLTEMHGLQFTYSAISAKSSQFVPQLNEVGLPPKLNFQYLPAPKWHAMLLYEFTPYYGKLSITKQTVINQALYFVGGGGVVNINNEENSFALVAGVGQNYYFTQRFGLKLDFRGLLFQSPDPFTAVLGSDTSTASVSRFQKTTNFNISITIGAMFLL